MGARTSTRLAGAAILLVALIAGACSSGDDDSGGADVAAQEAPARGADFDGGDSAGGGSGGSATRGLAFDDTATNDEGGSVGLEGETYLASATPDRVIKTAELQLEVEDGELGSVLREGREIAERAGGFLLSTSIDGTDRRRGGFSIRVPSGEFEETLTSLEKLGTVAAEDVSGEDVSQEFVDLEARLRNATAQEEVLFRLYDRSNTIADTIRVQRELEDVQLEIERLRGRLRYLEDRTSLSTISVTATETGAVTAAAGPFEKAWDKARDTFVAVVSGAIVGAGFLLPLAAFALLAYVVFRLVWPRLQRAPS